MLCTHHLVESVLGAVGLVSQPKEETHFIKHMQTIEDCPLGKPHMHKELIKKHITFLLKAKEKLVTKRSPRKVKVYKGFFFFVVFNLSLANKDNCYLNV